MLCLLSLLFLLTGCSLQKSEVVQSSNEIIEAMEPEAVIEYEVPGSVPGILVNQAGYDIKSEKKAVFRGENLPETFRVYHAESKKMIYEGEVEEKGYDEVTGERLAYGSFQDINTPGEYYIEADILGYSYPFSIGSEVYREVLNNSIQQFYEKIKNKTVLTVEEIRSDCEVVIILLLASELHGNAFGDAMGITESGNNIPDLTDVLFKEINLLMEQREKVLLSEDWELVSYYAAAMAKFSYTYKEYDSVFATECLQLADAVWNYMEKNGRSADRDMRFLAATELYRASGRQKYHYFIKEYGAEENVLESRESVYGAVTYLSTRQSVNIDLCSAFMKIIMEKAEKIAADSKTSFYQINLNSDSEEILWNMVVFTVVDKVISNHEYDMVIENHLHYFLGRNPSAVSFVDGVGVCNYAEGGQDLVLDGGFKEAAFLFILSEVNDKV